jgi:hypothetical protein
VPDAVDDNVVPPVFSCSIAPLDAFIHCPFELVVVVTEYAVGAASRVSVAPVLVAGRSEALIEIESRGG